jgi:hypothetical protein
VPIDAQINDIINWTWLLGAAGTRYYYSNFGEQHPSSTAR